MKALREGKKMKKYYFVNYRFKAEDELTDSDIQRLQDQPDTWIYVGEFADRESAIMAAFSR